MIYPKLIPKLLTKVPLLISQEQKRQTLYRWRQKLLKPDFKNSNVRSLFSLNQVIYPTFSKNQEKLLIEMFNMIQNNLSILTVKDM